MNDADIAVRLNRQAADIVGLLIAQSRFLGERVVFVEAVALAQNRFDEALVEIGRGPHARVHARSGFPAVEAREFVEREQVRFVELEACAVFVRNLDRIAAVGRADHLHDRLDDLLPTPIGAHQRVAPFDTRPRQDAPDRFVLVRPTRRCR